MTGEDYVTREECRCNRAELKLDFKEANQALIDWLEKVDGRMDALKWWFGALLLEVLLGIYLAYLALGGRT